MRAIRLPLVALFALPAAVDCSCLDPLQGLPTPKIEILDDAGNSHLTAEPWLTVDFGDADSGQQQQRTLTIKNVGTGRLELQSMCVVAAADVETARTAPCILGAAPFTFASLVGQVARADESLTLAVTFSPLAGGPASVFLQVGSTAKDEPVAAVQLTGRGTDGRLCAEPGGIIDFGQVAVGVTQPGTVTLRNCGVKPVTIATMAFAQNPDQAFTFTPQGGDPVGRTLAENETVVLDLTFTPQQAGPYRDARAGDIMITTAAPFAAQYDLLLLGDGVIPPACKINVVPETLNFNAVASGTTQTRQIIIQSVGQCGCTIDAIAGPEPSTTGFAFPAGELPAAYPVVLRGTVGCDGDPAGADAAPTNLTLDVSYTSPVRDNPVVDRATVTVTVSDETEPTQLVNLEANGGGAPYCQLQVEPIYTQQFGFNVVTGRWGVVEFGRTSVHTEKRLPITLENIGNADCTVSSLTYDDPDNTSINEFRLENADGTPAIPAAAFTVSSGVPRTFFAVFAPTHTIDNASPISFSFGSYSATIPGGDPSEPSRNIICGGGILTDPNEKCNGVRFETDDTRTDVSASDQDPGVYSIGFSGTPVEPDVDVIPPELDFGLVTLDCGSPTMRTTLYNNGGDGLRVMQPFVDPATNPETFRVMGTNNPTGSWPYTINPGASMSIDVRYYARQLTIESANLVVPTQLPDGNEGPPVSVPLRGQGTTDTFQTDVFDQFTDPKVDVLWVVDDSGSMSDFQDELSANFPQFFTLSGVSGADYHIAVTTTLWADDTCMAGPGSCSVDADCGAGGQCIMGLCTAGDAANTCDDHEMAGWYTACDPARGHYISPTSATPDADFDCNVHVSDPGNVNPNRPSSDSAEGGLRAAMKFLSPPLIDDPNANGGFLRDDAKLHIIFVEDEPEQSKGGVDQYIDFFKNVKGFRNASLVAVSAIAAPPGGCTYTASDGSSIQLQDDRYQVVVDEMNGRFQEICNDDWSGMMSQLGLDSMGLRVEFFLSRAAQPGAIDVCVRNPAASPTCTPVSETSEGAATGWFFDPASNSVVFNGTSVPPRGSRIEVSYGTACYP
ncbi:MAG: choice-of-anchor D domain-containing protein [Deltaproteobacteria bacterium]|nr:choice-of-anchor D domain-containing protein [Deltaproteobacteria bacterium]